MAANNYIMLDENGNMICGGDHVRLKFRELLGPTDGIIVWHEGQWQVESDCDYYPLAVIDSRQIKLIATGQKGREKYEEARERRILRGSK